MKMQKLCLSLVVIGVFLPFKRVVSEDEVDRRDSLVSLQEVFISAQSVVYQNTSVEVNGNELEKSKNNSNFCNFT